VPARPIKTLTEILVMTVEPTSQISARQPSPIIR